MTYPLNESCNIHCRIIVLRKNGAERSREEARFDSVTDGWFRVSVARTSMVIVADIKTVALFSGSGTKLIYHCIMSYVSLSESDDG